MLDLERKPRLAGQTLAGSVEVDVRARSLVDPAFPQGLSQAFSSKSQAPGSAARKALGCSLAELVGAGAAVFVEV